LLLSAGEKMKTVVVTGSSKGIGLGLAEAFLQRGCNVVLSSRTQAKIYAEHERLSDTYGAQRLAACACDVIDVEQLRSLWKTAKDKFGTVDVWVNNAGIANTTRPLWELDSAEIPRVINTNMTGVIYGTQVALQGMLEQGSGQIYNTEGFGSDDMVLSGLSVYGTTKRGLRYFTEAVAEEVKEKPVQVGAISPGIVLTDFLFDDVRKMTPEKREQVKAIYNMLGDEVEVVTPWLVDEILKNEENGSRIIWLDEARTNAYMADEDRMARDMFSKHGL
jgi:NAD(P)-dependent dehydrogenase (short-subunit alcohol dehydrogenase family)